MLSPEPPSLLPLSVVPDSSAYSLEPFQPSGYYSHLLPQKTLHSQARLLGNTKDGLFQSAQWRKRWLCYLRDHLSVPKMTYTGLVLDSGMPLPISTSTKGSGDAGKSVFVGTELSSPNSANWKKQPSGDRAPW